MYSHDNRVVITLDAGGTNLVFGAIQANKFIVEPITLPSHAEDLDKVPRGDGRGVQGRHRMPFGETRGHFVRIPRPGRLPQRRHRGVIFPTSRRSATAWRWARSSKRRSAFRSSSNNDGDLFAYGEALGGALPQVNARLEALNSSKRYKNLVGYTL